MVVVLILEIASALVALAALIAMIVNMARAEKTQHARVDGKASGHMKVAMALVGAAVVHGVCAMVYDSGAIAATYAFGWLAAACAVACGLVMTPALRSRIGAGAPKLHRALFIACIVFVLAHIVAGRL